MSPIIEVPDPSHIGPAVAGVEGNPPGTPPSDHPVLDASIARSNYVAHPKSIIYRDPHGTFTPADRERFDKAAAKRALKSARKNK